MTDNLLRLVPSTPEPRVSVSVSESEQAPSSRSRKPDDIPDGELVAVMAQEDFVWERAAKKAGVSKGYLYERLEHALPKASALSTTEIQAALDACGGDQRAAAARLRVSERGLKLRLSRGLDAEAAERRDEERERR